MEFKATLPEGTDLQVLGLSRQEHDQLAEIEAKQAILHQWLKSKNLAREERQALGLRSYDDFVAFWSSVSEDAQSKFSQKHKKGWKKWVKTSQGYASEMGSLMKNMKPLLDIVSSLGAPYTGAAIGTLTGLFLLAGTKTELDNTVCSAITGIKDRLPGFQMYQKIYQNDSDLKKKMILSYVLFIDLSISITKYCYQSGFSRWIIAIFNGSKFKDKTDLANEAVTNVRMKCEELLNERVYELNNDVQSLRTKTKELEVLLKKAEKEKHGEVLLTFKAGLNIKNFDLKLQYQELQDYQSKLLDESKEEGQIFEQMSTNRIKELQKAPVFASWSNDSTPSVLLLHGRNNRDIGYGKASSWVSLFAVDYVVQLQKPASLDAHGYYVFGRHSSIHHALAVILFHLLNHHLCDLGPHERRERLQHELRIYSSRLENRGSKGDILCEDEDAESAASLQKVALAVFSLFPANQKIYVVMDRIDKCRKHEQYDLMDILGHLVQNVVCNLKILLIADSVSWGVSAATYRKTFGGKLHLIELRQEILKHNSY
ncbi:putative Fungal STAND N-terminal Goodbye domain-containing protein [Seiridium cardinale]|uniref:Fungal STAND N-terminal Goodbye domain-containing protein n=1 Tax=Seiridium cardinale TaxID=138064 RepID=A0ABR2Y2R6_9PEZI